MKNILLLNAGTRNTLVRYFKETVAGRANVVVTDNFFLAPALYEGDKYYITSWIDKDGYWDEIEEICIKEDIGLIVSLIDPELELLAQERQRFEKRGILVNTSDYDVIHSTFKKSNVLSFLEQEGYPAIKTYTELDGALRAVNRGEVSFPLFVKPDFGSGSVGIRRVDTRDELISMCKKGYIIQEYMDSCEIGVDVYTDLISGEVVSVFAKKKLKMRAGETDKSVSIKDDKLFDLIERFVKHFGLRGVNDIDVFERDGEFFISEVNPRFGGGYLHAYGCGVNFIAFLMNNMEGICNEPCIGEYLEGRYMMKYFDVKFMDGNSEEN